MGNEYMPAPGSEAQPLMAGSGGPSDVGAVGAGLFVPFAARQVQDKAYSYAWGFTYGLTLVLGIFTFINRNVDFTTQISPDYLSDRGNCPVPNARRSLFSMRSMDEGNDPSDVSDGFLWSSLSLLFLSVVGSGLMGLLFLMLVRHKPAYLVWMSIIVQVGLPLIIGTTAAIQGNVGGSVPLFIIGALMVLLFWLWRDQLELVVALLGVSGRGLRENLGLIGASIGIQACVMLALCPLLITLMVAFTNGHVVPSSAVFSTAGSQCIGADGQQVFCCAWQLDGHVIPVFLLASLALLWTSFVGNEVRTFTVAGTISQWYFAPVQSGPSDKRSLSGAWIRSSIKAALTTSFGSLCFGALVLSVVSILRSMLENLKNNQKRNIIFFCLYMILSYVLTLIEMVTKFATVRLAINGESFWEGTKQIGSLLKRNFLDVFGVWWLPPFILQMSSMVIAGIWALGVYGISAAAWHKNLQEYQGFAILLAVVAFVITWIVLSFFISLLLNVIDTVYICFAMDRDHQTCSHVEIAEVYTRLPSVGPVIENPDGGLSYAAPTTAPVAQRV